MVAFCITHQPLPVRGHGDDARAAARKHGLGARVETAEVIESSNIFRLETSGIVMVCLSTAKSDAVAISLGDALTKKARSSAMGRFAERYQCRLLMFMSLRAWSETKSACGRAP
jgi:hypothetical protein